tara:strand:- start:353 stop:574 length:222 start_codon:yes stop_codon:yes gene_type:complete
MTPQQQWKDLIARERSREKKFREMATYQRKEKIRANKERRFLDALICGSKESEYRATARQVRSFINDNKHRER